MTLAFGKTNRLGARVLWLSLLGAVFAPSANAIWNGIAPPAKYKTAADATFVAINDADFLCTAVWIAPKVALTAAHCLHNEKDGGVLVRGTSIRSTKVFVDTKLAPLSLKTRTDDQAVTDIAVVYFEKGKAPATLPLFPSVPGLSQPITMLGWGVTDPAAKTAEEKSLVQLFGSNSIAARPLKQKILRVSSEIAKKPTDGSNANCLPGDSGSGLLDEDGAALVGICSVGGITQDSKKLISTYVGLHSDETLALFEKAAKDIGAEFPQTYIDTIQKVAAARLAANTPAPMPPTTVPPTTAPPTTNPPPTTQPPMATQPPVVPPKGTGPGTAPPVPAVAQKPRPPRRDDAEYLTVDAEFAKQILEASGVAVSEGIYRTDQEVAEWRADLRLPLVAEAVVDMPPYDGVERARVGFAFDQSKEVWLITQTQLRYRLVDEKGASAVFLAGSRHVVPMAAGVVHFDANWKAKYRSFQAITDLDLGVRAFLVSRRPKTPKLPVVLTDAARERLLLPHWELDLRGPFPEDADEPTSVEMSLFDPEVATKAEPLLTLTTSMEWPFFLRTHGIFRIDEKAKKLVYRELDWRRPALSAPKEVLPLDGEYQARAKGTELVVVRKVAQGAETALLVDSDGRIARQTGRKERFVAIDAASDAAVAALPVEPRPKDLFGMPRVPYLYGGRRANMAMSKALGASRGTWTILVYEDGQRPDDVATAFLSRVANGSIEVGPALASLERAWRLPGNFIGSTNDADRQKDMLETLLTGLDGKRTMAFLPDFPTKRSEASDIGVTQLETFWHTFEKCIEAGTCRFLTTMRADVYAELARKLPNILSQAKAIELPKLDGKERDAVAALLRRSLESEYGRVLSSGGFDALMRFGATASSKRQSPQREEDLLREFFDWAEEAAPRTTEISAEVTRRFVSRERSGVAAGGAPHDIAKLRAYLLANMVGQDDAVDKAVAFLKPLQNGAQASKIPIFFVLLGSPGTGKTHLANLIATYLTGEDSNLLVDFKNFKGFDTAEVKKTFAKLQSKQRSLRVVTFDDVDRGTMEDIDQLRSIFDNGMLGEISFANTIVILTANWGEDLILQNTKVDAEFFEKLRRNIVFNEKTAKEDPNPRGKISNRVMSSLDSRMIVMPPLASDKMLQLAMSFVTKKAEGLRATSGGKEVFVHPKLLAKLVLEKSAASTGARGIQSKLDSKVYPLFEDAIADRDVQSVIVVENNGKIIAVSNKTRKAHDQWMKSRKNAEAVIADPQKGQKWFLENFDEWFDKDWADLEKSSK